MANVGVGNAATAISKLLGKSVAIDLPDTRFIPIHRFAEETAGAETVVVSLYLSISGDLQGECIFMFPMKSALELINLLTGGQSDELGELELSAFKEFANIFTGSYLNSLAEMLSMAILPSAPYVASDMAQSVIDFLLIKLSRTADEILCVKTQIEIEGHGIDGSFTMLFENESFTRMLDALHKKFGV